MFDRRFVGALGAMLVALAWPFAARAGEGDLVDVTPSKAASPTQRPGINPQAAPEANVPPGQSAQPPVSTTQTTAAVYDARAAAERPVEVVGRKPNRAMLITGTSIFAGTYVASAIVAGLSDTKGDDKLFIPVVGPWLDIGERDCTLGECTAREDWNILMIIGSGVAQAAGLGIAVASFFVSEGRPLPAEAKVQVMPMRMGRGGAGIGAFGTF